jgi:hypothetical protein
MEKKTSLNEQCVECKSGSEMCFNPGLGLNHGTQ